MENEKKDTEPTIPRKPVVVREAITTVIETPKPEEPAQEKTNAQVARRHPRQS